jgi:hypothetical protein
LLRYTGEKFLIPWKVTLDNLTLLGIIITVLWLVVIGYYFYTSRQQSGIIEDVDELRALLDATEQADES